VSLLRFGQPGDFSGWLDFNRFGASHLPGHLDIEFSVVDRERVACRMPVRIEVMAPNGYLHAGAVVSMADSACGYGCVANLPEDATGFTTIELKSNFLGTARDGHVVCEAEPIHLGRTTQVWDATIKHEQTGKTLALFRCTQMVLWPKA
jgi:1,4-dihydroxy-2-naphthoyl-CoA hydrolase